MCPAAILSVFEGVPAVRLCLDVEIGDSCHVRGEVIDIRVVAGEDLGDIFPRKVLYHPLTGKVQVKKLRSLHNQTIIDRETHYLEDLDNKPAAGEVELF